MSQVMLNRLIPLWDSLCQSAQQHGCATSEDRRSFRTRARAEGLPYVSDGLAGLGRCVLDGIRNGYVTKESFAACRFALKENSTLPVFLYSAWSKVFTDDGHGIGASFEIAQNGDPVLTDWTPTIEAKVAVRWLRQLTVVFSKLRLPHDEMRVQAVFERFRANEEDLARMKGCLWHTQYANTMRFPHSSGSTQRLTDVLLNARRLLHKILCNVDPKDISPRHGSGASACRTRPWERYGRVLFDPEQNAIWPWLEFATAGRDHTDQTLSCDFITNGYPKVARGVFVPKDYRGPRLISCEPASSMYYQQGLMTKLISHLETHAPTRRFVNFTDQSINQELAREGSVSRETATLDLKDASDRLSWDLVVLLWPKHWMSALSAVRSKVTEIDVPGMGTIKVPLRKHAPMGSAVCFPVMALTIWCLIKAAHFSKGRAKAWIYGDDIIVASRDAVDVCNLLDAVGLRVNRDKSFTGPTPFRESCGKEYWNGSDVTPVYCRYDASDDDTAIGTLCAFANNFAVLRGPFAAYELVDLVHKMTAAPIIGVPDDLTSEGLPCSDTWLSPDWGTYYDPCLQQKAGSSPRPHLLYGTYAQCKRQTMVRRWNNHLQKWEYRIRRPLPVTVGVSPTTWGYVLRSLLIGGDLGFAEAVALAKRVSYKYGWVALDW